ncbi:hypothetical protein PPERSA_06917 [Pseudocohnilembus persalinus]|uniref:Uncharacterized protein n=1 Tax=Pseudocohnilembus persalinus TaxID=266149 RepID=A0A0V0QYG9_PSEPJ|nr:hypothetical protein PPERSA_06917 [Pseudocohnilembus persalinus]|eukprot:KRX07302.1 hypothetical protein PPERSA_06917 [Pseudocohnilembus persalinus]
MQQFYKNIIILQFINQLALFKIFLQFNQIIKICDQIINQTQIILLSQFLLYNKNSAAANNAMITNKFLEYFGTFIKTQTKLQTLKLSFRKWGLCRQGMYTLGYKDFGGQFNIFKI